MRKTVAVQSRHLLERIEPEGFRFFCPLLADELVRREALEGLEPAAKVVGGDEVGEAQAELVVALLLPLMVHKNFYCAGTSKTTWQR